MRKHLAVASLVVCLGAPALAADATGDWFVEDKAAVIRVTPCGNAMCGHIAWHKGPPGTDKNNPDPSKRNRPILGLPIILGMKPAAGRPNRWEGEIYNGQEGKTYSGSITLISDNTLRIEGCVLGFLCGGQNWARAKCDEAPAAGGGRPAAPGGSRPPSAAPPAVTACRVVGP
jgi:uncharacterized protein (DUF2147 family)